MKNKSTLAKLLSEEDVNVVHKQMPTAYFDSKKRELGLPIWKEEEMTKEIYDLMVCHEIGHALWTPLDMLEKAGLRNIDHSFVNIIEDVRIEKKVQNKYPGSRSVFKRGYIDLIKKDFFGTNGRDIDSFNLIDRINLFFKNVPDVTFSDEENVWVKKVSGVKTEDEVLDLAEELYAWMSENKPEEDENENEMGMPDESGDSDESEESAGGGNTTDSDDEGSSGSTSSSTGDNEGDGELTPTNNSNSDKSETNESSDTTETSSGGDNSGVPKAETDTAAKNGMDSLRDKNAVESVYVNIPKIDATKIIVDYKTVHKEFYGSYVAETNEGETYFPSTLNELTKIKEESKKTVAYMVKEFEMKKSADQYARAAVSKTGSLDMSKLHTYKYNEDLFKKVTTLPGATNHGMVMVLDWSGSMYENLKGTLAQLFNLIWFCRKVKIPFEVYAFSDSRLRRQNLKIQDFKVNDIILNDFRLLNFFSSKMSLSQEMDIMHALWMYASRWNRGKDVSGYALNYNANYDLGSTPLNEAIIAMMDIVPKFKTETRVQKVNTIFLTDGISNSLQGAFDYNLVTDGPDKGKHIKVDKSISYKSIVISDPVVGKTYESKDRLEHTNKLIKALKNRVENMNVIGFFIAGSGRSGRVNKRIIANVINEYDRTKVMEKVKFLNKNKYLAVTQCGYDEYYILPGGNSLNVENENLSDDLVGASKAKLKTAFGKSMKGKIESRQLLNKFVKLVA